MNICSAQETSSSNSDTLKRIVCTARKPTMLKRTAEITISHDRKSSSLEIFFTPIFQFFLGLTAILCDNCWRMTAHSSLPVMSDLLRRCSFSGQSFCFSLIVSSYVWVGESKHQKAHEARTDAFSCLLNTRGSGRLHLRQHTVRDMRNMID